MSNNGKEGTGSPADAQQHYILYLIPMYALAPSIGPHTRVGSKVLLHGCAASMIGFFCLYPVKFSPPT